MESGMRAPAIAITIWMFIMMLILGVVGYTYVLWTQYWRTLAEREQFSLLLQSVRLRSNGQLLVSGNLVNSDSNYYYPTPLHDKTNKVNNLGKKRKGNFSMTRSRRVKPGTILLHPIPLSRKRPAVAEQEYNLPTDKIMKKVSAYRNQLIIQMRKSQLENRNANFDKNKQNAKNHYKVKFSGSRSQVSFLSSGSGDVQRNKLLCQLKEHASLKMLDRNSEPFNSLGLTEYFPLSKLEESHQFNTCAIVSSAGSMYASKLGPEIDSHDAVMRFNTAPTTGFEGDVGKKTTMRFLNSQVVSKPEFNFFGSQLYRNVTLLVWDPSEYHSSLEQWFRKPEFDLFTPYWLRRKLFPNENFYIVDPNDVWNAWDFLQSNMASVVEHNPPSSGFLGILVMLNLCDSLDVYEYVPSMRLTKRCHYFDIHEDLGCTFGHWHPLATEKMLSLVMSYSNDIDIFLHGKISFPGFRKMNC